MTSANEIIARHKQLQGELADVEQRISEQRNALSEVQRARDRIKALIADTEREVPSDQG